MSFNKTFFGLHIGVITLFAVSEGFNSYVTISKNQLLHYLVMVCLYLLLNFITTGFISVIMFKIAQKGFGSK